MNFFTIRYTWKTNVVCWYLNEKKLFNSIRNSMPNLKHFIIIFEICSVVYWILQKLFFVNFQVPHSYGVRNFIESSLCLSVSLSLIQLLLLWKVTWHVYGFPIKMGVVSQKLSDNSTLSLNWFWEEEKDYQFKGRYMIA